MAVESISTGVVGVDNLAMEDVLAQIMDAGVESRISVNEQVVMFGRLNNLQPPQGSRVCGIAYEVGRRGVNIDKAWRIAVRCGEAIVQAVEQDQGTPREYSFLTR